MACQFPTYDWTNPNWIVIYLDARIADEVGVIVKVSQVTLNHQFSLRSQGLTQLLKRKLEGTGWEEQGGGIWREQTEALHVNTEWQAQEIETHPW